MGARHWTLDDIPWAAFDPSQVDPDILKIVKAASLVEYNGGAYADYLCNIFPDDPEFRAAAEAWAREEVQHGEALARWASLADPSFDFEDCFGRFLEGYQLPLQEAERSVRGSRTGELVARCIVEVGTSSYYSALGSATSEPALKSVCRHIAADELRHYKLFYTHLKRYLEREGIGRWHRVAIALGRINESEDDELSYAYFAANGAGEAYDHKRWCQAYMRRAYGYYRPPHVERAVSMSFKAAGLNPQSRLASLASKLVYRGIRWRWSRLVAAGV